jgi:hypothetical protein
MLEKEARVRMNASGFRFADVPACSNSSDIRGIPWMHAPFQQAPKKLGCAPLQRIYGGVCCSKPALDDRCRDGMP